MTNHSLYHLIINYDGKSSGSSPRNLYIRGDSDICNAQNKAYDTAATIKVSDRSRQIRIDVKSGHDTSSVTFFLPSGSNKVTKPIGNSGEVICEFVKDEECRCRRTPHVIKLS